MTGPETSLTDPRDLPQCPGCICRVRKASVLKLRRARLQPTRRCVSSLHSVSAACTASRGPPDMLEPKPENPKPQP